MYLFLFEIIFFPCFLQFYKSLEPPSKFKLQNMKYAIWNSNTYWEFQIHIRNSKYVFGIPNTLFRIPNTYLDFHIPIRNSKYVFGYPNTPFGIPNTYLEFQIPYSEFQIHIWISTYLFRIPNTYLDIQIRYSEFQMCIWNSKYIFGPTKQQKKVILCYSLAGPV